MSYFNYAELSERISRSYQELSDYLEFFSDCLEVATPIAMHYIQVTTYIIIEAVMSACTQLYQQFGLLMTGTFNQETKQCLDAEQKTNPTNSNFF
jgi:hypothetical protein